MINQLVGSDCEAYEQQLWLPPWKLKHTDVRANVTVEGISGSPRLAKNWRPTAVIGVDSQALYELKSKDPLAVEAAAYRTEEAWHVGVQAVAGARIFQPLGIIGFYGFDVRQGRGDADFTAGVYSFERRLFTSVLPGELKLIESNVPDEELPRRYPGTKLM
ncbi:MAG TPA: hypothetical protein VH234_03920 [Candidatus Saccharimonadales bacterium]|jgi:hypothetical protein|nr:hypothetical protein [Candidatus Saccharimonadales bacterium]